MNNNLIYFADSSISDLYDATKYKALNRDNVKLPIDFFVNNEGRLVDNSSSDTIIATPITVFFEVTKKCNLRCGHCFNASGEKYTNELKLDEIIDLIDQFAKAGVFSVKITGGEPFCRSDIMDILSYLDTKSINYIVYSNGTCISYENIRKLKSLTNMLKIRISVDGIYNTNDSIRGVGSFEKAMDTVKTLCANDIPCEINYTITKSNYLQLSELEKYLFVNKINCKINIGLVKIAGRAKSGAEEYYFTEENIGDAMACIKQQLQKSTHVKPFYLLEPVYYKIFGNSFGCPAGRLTTTIKYNGDIYPCGLLSEYLHFLCGNIRKDKFQVIWNNSKMDVFRNLPPNSACVVCKNYLKTCTGACRGNAMNFYNDICGRDINCFIYQVDFNQKGDK